MSKRGGSAQTLRDYWSGHGHAGPSHGAERDAIAWGTPGDFMRCVAQVTAHGRMTEDQAKGYCNLRHHEATGEWTAQHAKEERGKMAPVTVPSELAEAGAAYARLRAALKASGGEVTQIHVEGEGDKDHDGDGLFDADGDGDGAVATRVEKGYNPSQARVPAGASNSGQFGSNPAGTPAQQQVATIAAANAVGQKPQPKPKPGPPPEEQAEAAHAAHLRHEIHELTQTLNQLLAQKQTITSKLPARHTGSSVKQPKKPGTATASKPAAKPAAATGTKKPSAKKPTAASAASAALAAVNTQIAQVRQQIAQYQAQIAQTMAKSVGPRNPRDVGSGRFRTFQGELHEAKQALAEGRMNDVVELLGSARALAQNDRQRMLLGELQAAIGRTQHVQPELTKAGPHRYKHGWILLDSADASGPKPIKGDTVAARDANGRTVVGFHDGADSHGNVHIRHPVTGETTKVPREAVRVGTRKENDQALASMRRSPEQRQVEQEFPGLPADIKDSLAQYDSDVHSGAIYFPGGPQTPAGKVPLASAGTGEVGGDIGRHLREKIPGPFQG